MGPPRSVRPPGNAHWPRRRWEATSQEPERVRLSQEAILPSSHERSINRAIVSNRPRGEALPSNSSTRDAGLRGVHESLRIPLVPAFGRPAPGAYIGLRLLSPPVGARVAAAFGFGAKSGR